MFLILIYNLKRYVLPQWSADIEYCIQLDRNDVYADGLEVGNKSRTIYPMLHYVS